MLRSRVVGDVIAPLHVFSMKEHIVGTTVTLENNQGISYEFVVGSNDVCCVEKYLSHDIVGLCIPLTRFPPHVKITKHFYVDDSFNRNKASLDNGLLVTFRVSNRVNMLYVKCVENMKMSGVVTYKEDRSFRDEGLS